MTYSPTNKSLANRRLREDAVLPVILATVDAIDMPDWRLALAVANAAHSRAARIELSAIMLARCGGEGCVPASWDEIALSSRKTVDELQAMWPWGILAGSGPGERPKHVPNCPRVSRCE
jgi:hypothetical protein